MSLRIDSSEWISGALLIGETGLGVLGSAIPSTGDSGASYLYNDLSLPADADKEICGRITAWPASGELVAYEDGSFEFSGAADGAYSFSYQLYVDGVATGSPVGVDLAVGAGGTTVSTTLAGSWSVRNTTSAALSAAWGVRNSVTATASGGWSVRNSAASTLSASWSVRSLVGGTFTGAWAVQEAGVASATFAGSWSVRNGVSTTAPGSWSVRNSVASTQSGAWSVRNSASTSLIGAWSVRGLVAGSLPGAWSVLAAGAASGVLAGGWSVRGLSSASLAGAWSVQSEPGTAVYPLPGQVVAGVVYGPTGIEYTGTYAGTTGPSAVEIAAAVRFDLSAELARIDAAITSRATVTQIMEYAGP